MRSISVAAGVILLVGLGMLTVWPGALPWNGTNLPAERRTTVPNPPAKPNQLVIDAAIATRLLTSFDDTSRNRSYATAQMRDELNAVRAKTTNLVAMHAARAANEMASLPFASKVVVANGRDYFDDHNRTWTLFDHALAGTGQTLDNAKTEIVHLRSVHMGDVKNAERPFWQAVRVGNVPEPPPVSMSTAEHLDSSNVFKQKIFKGLSRHMSTAFPNVFKKSSMNLAKKQFAKLPAAAFDGPLPVAESALLMWGLYDVATEAGALHGIAQREIAAAISSEANAIVNVWHARELSDVSNRQQVDHGKLCQALAQALNTLLFPSKGTEIAKRCR